MRTVERSLASGLPVQYKRVYLWGAPLRAMHWLAALAVVVLVVTGFYIGGPYFLTGGEASDHFLMGTVRFLHFAAAGLLVATGIVRAYWLFVGNKFERWRALFPVRGEDWKNLWLVLKKYLFITPWRAPHYLAHNPLQQLVYTTVYAVALFQVATGFHLYGLSNPGGLFHTAFAWVGPLLGGAQGARFWHHVVTWFWVAFFPVHVYLTIRADLLHHESRVSSIVSGGRYVRADVEFVDD